ncbi:hypothetical protein MRB53_036336 [Persea americana]|nr:hypothetical protein MRB53_036405 [Persea americana]KAJ8614923.1 hypothetical protein MRB53_036336 [Persea americana]
MQRFFDSMLTTHKGGLHSSCSTDEETHRTVEGNKAESIKSKKPIQHEVMMVDGFDHANTLQRACLGESRVIMVSSKSSCKSQVAAYEIYDDSNPIDEVIPQVARAHAPIRISLQSKEISREVCHEKATPPIARRKNPIEIELSPTEDSGTSSSQAWVPPQPKNRRRIEIVEPSTEKALSTQSLGPSRRSPKIVRRKQPPEPKEATIAPVIVPTPKAGHEINPVTKTGRIYARPDPRVSQPKNQEETVADQAEKVATQPEYDLLGHLSKLPAHISILELLRTSPKHKELFFNFNQEAQVPATLTPEELQDVVEQITTKHALTFTEEDIPKGMDTSQ